MLSRDEFVRRILDGAPPEVEAAADAGFGDAMLEGFDGFDVSDDTEEATEDARFAQLLLEESGFGRGETLPRDEVVLGEQKTNRFLPHGATYWAKTAERPFHILLFDLDPKGSTILGDGFFRQNDQLEDALHRIVQDALEGFERGGEGRTADRKKGAQTETLCVVSVIDDRRDGPERQIVCFGTKCTATDALEVFTLREEARDWDRPLAEEHLGQLFERHFKRLGTGARWQDAFVSGEERKKARKLMDECARLIPDEKQLQTAIRELLDEIAGSFGLRRKGGRGGHRLVMHALPEDHSIAVDPDDARQKGFKNPFQGLRIFDADERLIGYIVYVLDKKSEAERLHRQLAQHNHFHNVLVVYPEEAGATLELWQGTEPLRGRLISGTRRSRFDGEGGVVQLLSRFFVVSRSAISTPSQLATELAWRAQHLKALAFDELIKEKEKPVDRQPLRDLLEVFNKALVSLDEQEFSDAYAQTITYGLLAARWLSIETTAQRFTRKNIDALLPSTSPFLHDLFQRLVNSRFDQNLSWLLDDITSLLSRTMVADVFRGEKDPSIHFYQDFLDAYDARIRRERGVYYTPDEVVCHIVDSVHSTLKRFGLRLGLADTSTWREVAGSTGLDVPPSVEPDEPFVQILDPATGTGTFLLYVVDVVHRAMMEEYEQQGFTPAEANAQWASYVRAHLLPRVSGFEIMMAPYIVSHLRLGLALQQTGFTFDSADRLRVLLTNTLDRAAKPQLALIGDHVTEEMNRVRDLQQPGRVTVLVGNPPYSLLSANLAPEHRALVEKYKFIGEERLKERGALQMEKILNDDYVKFIAYAEARIEEAGAGVLGLVTNHAFLDNPTMRGLRWHLQQTFPFIRLVELGGSAKKAGMEVDENVFDIQQGVSIIVGGRPPGAPGGSSSIGYHRLHGDRQSKLLALASDEEPAWEELEPRPRLFLFVPADLELWDEYAEMTPLDEVFPLHSIGFFTSKDHFVISRSRREVVNNAIAFRDSNLGDQELCGSLGINAKKAWNVARSREQLRELSDEDIRSKSHSFPHRPYDNKFVFYDRSLVWSMAWPVNRNMVDGDNLALITSRQLARPPWRHIFCSDTVVEMFYISNKTKEGNHVFPLYVVEDVGADKSGQRTILSGSPTRKPNIYETWSRKLCARTAGSWKPDGPGERATGVVGPEDVFAYVYAVLHSAEFRSRYEEFLGRAFPRVPFPAGPELFWDLVELGQQLIDVHRPFDGEVVEKRAALSGVRFVGELGGRIDRGFPKYKGGRVQVSASSYFEGVSKEEWGHTIGVYQLCKKWLDDRAGKRGATAVPIDQEQVRTFAAMVWSIRTSRRLESNVSAAIDKHGGWVVCFCEGSE